jgi:predicted RNA-binding protein YlqC (UPF0109 family)
VSDAPVADEAVDDIEDDIEDEVDGELDDDDTGDDVEDDDDDDESDAGNRVVGAIPRNVVDYLARNLVDDPDAVVVEADERNGRVDLRLHVAPDDMGKVIGKRGRVAQAIRTVVRAAGAREGVEASVDIVD